MVTKMCRERYLVYNLLIAVEQLTHGAVLSLDLKRYRQADLWHLSNFSLLTYIPQRSILLALPL